MSSPKLQLRHAWVSLGTDSFAKCEQGFAFYSFETGMRPSSRHARRWSVIRRAAIVNHGQMDQRRVSVDPFGSLRALPVRFRALIVARITTGFFRAHLFPVPERVSSHSR
jgi:hypothetical protein